MTRLRYRLGDTPPRPLDLAGRSTLSVGRESGQDIQLTSSSASRQHFLLEAGRHGWSVLPIGQHPGLLDGIRLRRGERSPVRSGSLLEVYGERLELVELPDVFDTTIGDPARWLAFEVTIDGAALSVRFDAGRWTWTDRALPASRVPAPRNQPVLAALFRRWDGRAFGWLTEAELFGIIEGTPSQPGAAARRHQVTKDLREWWDAQHAEHERARAACLAQGDPLVPEALPPRTIAIEIDGAQRMRLGLASITRDVQLP